MTEKTFQSQVVQLARLCGWRVYHTHDSRRSAPGFPDLFLVRAEKALAAELKVGRNRPTPEQTAWLESLNRAGVRAVLWTPADWDEIRDTLTGAA